MLHRHRYVSVFVCVFNTYSTSSKMKRNENNKNGSSSDKHHTTATTIVGAKATERSVGVVRACVCANECDVCLSSSYTTDKSYDIFVSLFIFTRTLNSCWALNLKKNTQQSQILSTRSISFQPAQVSIKIHHVFSSIWCVKYWCRCNVVVGFFSFCLL